jgi:hypothetical protein
VIFAVIACGHFMLPTRRFFFEEGHSPENRGLSIRNFRFGWAEWA